MPTNPRSRDAAAARSTDDDAGELTIAPATVLETSMLVASARLDNSVDPGEFSEMLTALIESVRHDERARVAFEAAAVRRVKRTIKFMTSADASKIRERANQVRGDRKKLPQGFTDQLAKELGYSKSQIQQAIYEQGV